MIFVDSDCIIAYLKGDPSAIKTLHEIEAPLFVSEISVFEVLFGIYRRKNSRKDELRAANVFFAGVEVVGFSDGCGAVAAKILGDLVRRGEVIQEGDVMIAATMKKAGASKIVTRNAKHFSRIPGVEVVLY